MRIYSNQVRPRPPVASDLPAKDRTKIQKISIVEINLGIFLKTKDIIIGWRIEVAV